MLTSTAASWTWSSRIRSPHKDEVQAPRERSSIPRGRPRRKNPSATLVAAKPQSRKTGDRNIPRTGKNPRRRGGKSPESPAEKANRRLARMRPLLYEIPDDACARRIDSADGSSSNSGSFASRSSSTTKNHLLQHPQVASNCIGSARSGWWRSSGISQSGQHST
jgi:hypothetical protein